MNGHQTERRELSLSDAEFERVANRAADIVEEKFYAQVGRSTVRRILFALGTGGGLVGAWELFKKMSGP